MKINQSEKQTIVMHCTQSEATGRINRVNVSHNAHVSLLQSYVISFVKPPFV